MKAALRREDERLVTGHGRYLDNLPADRLLHCAFVRSTVAHGRLTRVDLDEVRAAPGVVAAFAAKDLDLRDQPTTLSPGPDVAAMYRPPLAIDTVRHVGEPVAVIVAEDRYAAADAVDLAEVDIEPLRVVADFRAALAGETLLFPGTDSNVTWSASAPEKPEEEFPPLDSYPISVTLEVDNQRLAPVPIEPLGIRVVPTADGGITVWCGHQGPHRLRKQLADLVEVDRDLVRVISPDVGGAFGMKTQVNPEYQVAAALALRLGRPVQWQQTRYEQFITGTHGRAQHHRITLAGDREGRIGAARIEVVADLGAYPQTGGGAPRNCISLAIGPYAVRDVQVTVSTVVTNRAPIGAYRGAGRPEAAYALERAVDALAAAAGLDPIDVRRRNLIPADALPYRSPTGALYDSGDYRRAMELALEVAGADAVRREQQRRRESGGKPLGLGIATFLEHSGGPLGSKEYGRVELATDGHLIARAGSSTGGQGHETVWSQVVATVFDVDPDEVEVFTADTAEVADGGGSAGSRSAQMSGSTVHAMAGEVARRAREVAADLLEIDPGDLRIEQGRIAAAGDPLSGVDLAQIAAHAQTLGVELAAEETFDPGAQTFPYGTYVAVVEVDPETGSVALQRMVAVDDCGVVLNPQIVEGQVHGGTAQGIAQALYEGIEYDGDGQPLTTSLIDYYVPSAADLPDIITAQTVTPAPSNPLGAKGTGESGCVGAPPAVVNAVLDALRPYGVTDLQMPLTPERVWRALQEADGQGPTA